MNCIHCQSEIKEGQKFCPNCGKSPTDAVVRLNCHSCGAVLTADPGQEMMICPYCGSKQLFRESNELKIAKLNADTEKEKLRLQNERFRLQSEKEEKAGLRAAAEKYRKSFSKHWTVICIIISLLMAIVSISDGRPDAAVIAFIQAALFFVSWLFGMQIIPEKRPYLRRIPAIIAYILIIPFFLSWDSLPNMSVLGTDTWPEKGIVTRIPQPEGKNYAYRSMRSEVTSFRTDVYNIDTDGAQEYIAQCKEMGFVQDPNLEGSTFDGFDADGYELTIIYYSSLKEMSLYLYAPETLSALTWTVNLDFAQVPVPESQTGYIHWEYGTRYYVTVGETDYEAYNAYVKKCLDAGFDQLITRTQTRFEGYSAEGDHLRVEYIGLDRMNIEIQKKKDAPVDE